MKAHTLCIRLAQSTCICKPIIAFRNNYLSLSHSASVYIYSDIPILRSGSPFTELATVVSMTGNSFVYSGVSGRCGCWWWCWVTCLTEVEVSGWCWPASVGGFTTVGGSDDWSWPGGSISEQGPLLSCWDCTEDGGSGPRLESVLLTKKSGPVGVEDEGPDELWYGWWRCWPPPFTIAGGCRRCPARWEKVAVDGTEGWDWEHSWTWTRTTFGDAILVALNIWFVVWFTEIVGFMELSGDISMVVIYV